MLKQTKLPHVKLVHTLSILNYSNSPLIVGSAHKQSVGARVDRDSLTNIASVQLMATSG